MQKASINNINKKIARPFIHEVRLDRGAAAFDAFSKHGLWRCECTESEQKSTKPLICVQVFSMAVAPGERTTAGLGCSPGCGPTVRVAAPEVADPAHPQRGMPRVRHKRGVFFRPSDRHAYLDTLSLSADVLSAYVLTRDEKRTHTKR